MSRIALASLPLVSAWACRPGEETAIKQSRLPAAPQRGDHVVVEPRAAEFFEARVLAVTKDRLRVEPAHAGDPSLVSISDVYPLTATASAPTPGMYAICKAHGAWIGCRVQRGGGDALVVATVNGETQTLPTSAVLAASPSTELNLRQAFSRARERARFASDAERAGAPTAPAGFRPQLRERVLARRNGAWFSATIQDVDEQDLYVVFATEAVRERVAPSDVVPEPPWPKAPSRGDFVLARPHGPAEPWQTMRVVGASDREFRVSNAVGEERVLAARDVVPLGEHDGNDELGAR